MVGRRGRKAASSQNTSRQMDSICIDTFVEAAVVVAIVGGRRRFDESSSKRGLIREEAVGGGMDGAMVWIGTKTRSGRAGEVGRW